MLGIISIWFLIPTLFLYNSLPEFDNLQGKVVVFVLAFILATTLILVVSFNIKLERSDVKLNRLDTSDFRSDNSSDKSDMSDIRLDKPDKSDKSDKSEKSDKSSQTRQTRRTRRTI